MRIEVLNWWKQAKRDLESAGHALEYGDYYLVAFLSHQAVEKALKAVYIKKFGELIKVHDISFLARKNGLPEELVDECIRLNPAYIDSRYPDATGKLPVYSYKKEIAEPLFNAAKKVIKWVEKEL